MKITVSDVEHIARLARLDLQPDEKQLFASQMDAILGYAEKLNELDTNDVLPASHALNTSTFSYPFRDDRATSSIGIPKALANAPEAAGSFYKVPKVIE